MVSEDLKGHPARPPRGIRPVFWFVVCGFMAALSGCGGCSPSSTTSTPGPKRPPDPAGRDLLEPAISMMQPENLGIKANPEQPAGLLNQWRAGRMKNAGTDRLSEPLPEETRKLLENELSAEAVKRAERDDFILDDVRHIRTAYLMKDIVDHVAKGVDGELNRARAVFDFVTRNVELVSEKNALPLTPYEMLIFGEGTAADRAWIFAELLRQLNQDAVIVRPHSAEAGKSPWFVGAVAKQQIHLFDPLRSTPVPTELRADIAEIVPATLADLSNPAVLAALTGGTEYRLSAEMFKKVRLEVIGTSALWSPRLRTLQGVLTGENSVVISQQLTAGGGNSASVIDRLRSVENSRWNPDALSLWKHPESRLEGFDELDSLSERWKPFEAPQHVKVDPETGEVQLGSFSKLQLITRTEQLNGQFKEAIQGYMRIQLAHRHMGAQLTGDVRELHADAAEDARFWSGVCQMEQGIFEEAANKFGAYVKEAERFTGSRHAEHARILLARCLIPLGRAPEAAEALEPLKPDSPEYETAMFLQHALANGKPSAVQPENSPPDNAQTNNSVSLSPDPSKPDSQTPEPNQPAIAEKPAG